MSEIFKITLKPIIKERVWEVRNIGANRKHKICEICATELPPGSPSTTFTKRVSEGMKTIYRTHHTCNHNLKSECALKMAEKLEINLNQSFIN